MAVNFITRERSAFNEGSGISILLPRVLPSDQAEKAGSIEYQYTLTRDGERIGALGLMGDRHLDRASTRLMWTYTLDLRPSWVLQDIIRLKPFFGTTEQDFTFLKSIARGLVTTFEGQTTNSEDLRYVALTSYQSLVGEGISEFQTSRALNEDEIVLAEVVVPAHIA